VVLDLFVVDKFLFNLREKMINDLELEKLRANQRFLAMELRNRGIEVDVFDWDNEILIASNNKKKEYFYDICSSIMPLSVSNIASSKSLTKILLNKNNVTTPKGFKLLSNELDLAVELAEKLGFPVVIKPSLGVQGELVHTDIDETEEVQFVLLNIQEQRGIIEVLMEEQFIGKEYRIFYTINDDYAVLLRDPAHVIGDGQSTIKELAEKETYRRMNPRINCLCPIALDLEASRYLRKKNLSFYSIPKKGKKVYLRSSSNIMMGGVCTDVTEDVHPSVLKIAKRALSSIPNLPYAGIDFMCNDISKEQTPESYRVLELNSVPGIGMHINPAIGKSRNVPGMIIDLIF